MTSTFTWLDTSERQRSQMLDVINLFREKETRDELGIGTVRDAFADRYFPGTSTIQTRARYFLFIPWIYTNLERTRVPSDKIAYRVRNDETYLINALYDNGATDGLIGINARGTLKRMPSAIYWSGLGAWGLRLYPDPLASYHRSLDTYYAANRQLAQFQRENRSEDIVSETQLRQGFNWHPGCRELRPRDFPTDASFDLTPDEARYLQERIITHQPDTLLAYLAANGEAEARTVFSWEQPGISELPAHLQEQLFHGRCFSLTIHGAALLYNLMLAERVQKISGTEANELVDIYREALNDWASEMAQTQSEFNRWDWQVRFWEIVTEGGARIPVQTQRFVNNWLQLTLDFQPASIPDQSTARNIIQHREQRLKGKLSRLTNPRTLELWSGAAGTGRLNYRWTVTQTLLRDIWEGLNRA